MAIGDDFSISTNGSIKHNEAETMERREFWDQLFEYGFVDHDSETEFGPLPKTHTVLEFHRWLQDLADDEYSESSVIDITTETPSTRSTDNLITLHDPYYIDENTAKFLDDGTLVTQHATYTNLKKI